MKSAHQPFCQPPPHAGRTHPGFLGTAVRICAPDAKPRYQGLTTRLQEMGKQPVPWWFVAVVSERDAIT
jgi:hypothetical protein